MIALGKEVKEFSADFCGGFHAIASDLYSHKL